MNGVVSQLGPLLDSLCFIGNCLMESPCYKEFEHGAGNHDCGGGKLQ